MKIFMFIQYLLYMLFWVACNTNALKYHDRIAAAHEKILTAQNKLDEVFNKATGHPEQQKVVNQQLSDFKNVIKQSMDEIQKLDKYEDDALKNAFLEHSKGILKVVDKEYNELSGIITLTPENMTEEINGKEEKLIMSINYQFDQIGESFQKAQEQYAAKHNITLE